jgi:hypothetical protein
MQQATIVSDLGFRKGVAMRMSPITLVGAIFLVAVFVGAIRQALKDNPAPAPPSTNAPPSVNMPPKEAWSTYRTPDGRVSFQYPSHLTMKHGQRTGDRDPDVQLLVENADDSLSATFIMHVSQEPDIAYAQRMIQAAEDGNTIPITEQMAVQRENAKGLQREFRETKGNEKTEYIALALEAPPHYVHITAAYRADRKPELRAICEKIIKSLEIKKLETK